MIPSMGSNFIFWTLSCCFYKNSLSYFPETHNHRLGTETEKNGFAARIQNHVIHKSHASKKKDPSKTLKFMIKYNPIKSGN